MSSNSAFGLETGFRAGFRPDSNMESFKKRAPEGRPENRCSRFPDENPAEILPGTPISSLEALLRKIEKLVSS